MAVIVNKDNIKKEVFESEKPVILDFYADNCIPCKAVAPIIDEIEDENPDIKIAKCNASVDFELALELGVMASPTLIYVKDGVEIGRKTGVASKEEILEELGV